METQYVIVITSERSYYNHLWRQNYGAVTISQLFQIQSV